MLVDDGASPRSLRTEDREADLVVVGGGVAGVCAAITAAREGLKVTLVQDRPVLGGNASSEVRLWMVGATSHMGNNNRWAREGGVLNEILVENTFRNPDGNPVIFDTVMLDKAVSEPNLRLLLNTAVFEVEKHDDGSIAAVVAFCAQNSTRYTLRAPLFCDASGDGVVGFLAGAAFRIGAEARSEFGEQLAREASGRDLLGHSIYFYTRDAGHPVPYVAPSYALRDITKIPRYRRFSTKEQGTDLWWIEYGGSRDTVHESESIKWELWKVIYGVWDYIKNSGEHPDSATLTLDWVGLIPGKRESRRFEGDYMLVQQDVVEQRTHYDAVSYGGWAIDHHPVDNIYSEQAPCTQWHSKGVYQIPYRTMYSRNVANLFITGRLLSASHIAFGSSRVMATCGHNGQAVGVAAAVCHERSLNPRDLSDPAKIGELQRRLLTTGQTIPRVRRQDAEDLAQQAEVTSSSSLTRLRFEPSGTRALADARAILIPLAKGPVPPIGVRVRSRGAQTLVAALRVCSRSESFTPDVVLDRVSVGLPGAAVHGNGSAVHRTSHAMRSGASGHHSAVAVLDEADNGGDGWTDHEVTLTFSANLQDDAYAFVCLNSNAAVEVWETAAIVTGVTTVVHRHDTKVAKSSMQTPPEGSGIDSFEFWTPERRPKGRNLAVSVDLPSHAFVGPNAVNGFQRPTSGPNAWVASPDDPRPTLTLRWPNTVSLRRVELVFDPDWDHPMENVVMRHAQRVMPTTVRSFRVLGPGGVVLAERRDNHQTVCSVDLLEAVSTDRIDVELDHPSADVPAALFEVRCYSS
ncbi:MAG: FAD-dependent oxidoreductase [Lacipirellulaceae bacterium]